MLTWLRRVEPMEQRNVQEEIAVNKNEGEHRIREDRQDVVELTGKEVSLNGVVGMRDDVLTEGIQLTPLEVLGTPTDVLLEVLRSGLPLP